MGSWTPVYTGSVKCVAGYELSLCLVTFALLQPAPAVVASDLTTRSPAGLFFLESLRKGQWEAESRKSRDLFWQEMGTNHHRSDVEKQQGGGTCREGGTGGIRSLELLLNGTLNGLALSELLGQNLSFVWPLIGFTSGWAAKGLSRGTQRIRRGKIAVIYCRSTSNLNKFIFIKLLILLFVFKEGFVLE